MDLICDRDYDSEGSTATSSESPEEVPVLTGIGCDEFPVGCHNLVFQSVVRSKAKSWRECSVSAALKIATGSSHRRASTTNYDFVHLKHCSVEIIPLNSSSNCDCRNRFHDAERSSSGAPPKVVVSGIFYHQPEVVCRGKLDCGLDVMRNKSTDGKDRN